MNTEDKIAEQAAEIDRLNAALANRKAKIAELMGEAARAEIAVAAPVDRSEQSSDYILVRAAAKDLFNKSFADPEVRISSESESKRDSVQAASLVFQAALKSTAEPSAATSAAPLPEQTGPSVTAEEIGKIAMSLIGELTSDLADSDDEEEVYLNGTARGIGHLHAELLKLLKSKPSASPSPAPAQQQEPSAVILATLLRAALKAAELGRGSYHQNYDGNALGHAIEELLESVEPAAPGASTEDKQ